MIPTSHEFFNSFINYELKPFFGDSTSFNLQRVKRLLQLVGNPQKDLKIIHVVGTKGKGSTCVFTANILKAAGYKVGLYTSPHLSSYRERIKILDNSSQENKNGFLDGQIDEKEINGIIEQIRSAVKEIEQEKTLGELTFFEVYTVLALCHFYRCRVDVAVLEAGLGGRLDATNAVDSLVCAITPISLEHTQFLGSTIEEIAAEKAAVVKNKNQTVIIAPQKEEAMQVIKRRCAEVGVKTVFIGQDVHLTSIRQDTDGQVFNVVGKHEYISLRTQLIGKHQIANAATAVAIIESLNQWGIEIDKEAVAEGIEQTLWPGRFEIRSKKPLMILDGAHNEDSCRMLVQTVKEIFPSKKAILVLSVSEDKDKKKICFSLNEIAKTVILTRTKHPRASGFTRDDIKDFFHTKDITQTANVREALKIAFEKAVDDDIILVTGSIFLVGEAREIC